MYPKHFRLIGCAVFLYLAVFTGAFTSAAEPVLFEGYSVRTAVELKADGPEGKDTYKLIRSVLGDTAIEAPDLYGKKNHQGVKHIVEETDDEVGHHFVFKIHRDLDKDRDRYPKVSDRQRNEIKAYSGSSPKLKGYKGETMVYEWKFKIQQGMAVTSNFTHLFQLKAVGGDDKSPISTITARLVSGKPVLEIRHIGEERFVVMDRYDDLEAIQGKWLVATCKATYGENGSLAYTVRTLDGEEVLSTSEENLKMWLKGNDFVRPKWGIYRSLKQVSLLNAGEDRVRFADFVISKLKKLN